MSEPVLLSRLMVLSGVAPTNAEARRLIAQGGVQVDEQKVDDTRAVLDTTAGRTYLLKVGKRRFVRVLFS